MGEGKSLRTRKCSSILTRTLTPPRKWQENGGKCRGVGIGEAKKRNKGKIKQRAVGKSIKRRVCGGAEKKSFPRLLLLQHPLPFSLGHWLIRKVFPFPFGRVAERS